MKHKYAIARLAGYFFSLSMMVVMVGLFGSGSRSAFADTPSFVRIIHASPFVGTADVFLDGKKILSDFGFGTVTGYVTIPPGPHKVQISLIGKGIGASVITQTLSVSPGVAYTVAAIGDKPNALGLQAFVDDNRLQPGLTKVRFYHLSPGTGSYNVSEGGKQVVQGLSYQSASTYVSVQPGSYTFNVDVSQPNSQLPVSATLKANMVTSEFAVGVFNGTPKIQFVSAEVSGIPGMPGTGSDPNPSAAPGAAPSSPLGLVQVLLLLVVGVISLTLWRFFHPLAWVRKPAERKERSHRSL
ncbi:MAG TPA: DUF4397 domain-containing protein [Ktedonobacteraceae bacterium]|nr:DUF4397 domain-containing protein [Ktedonobacteraceae bacterium]